MKRRRIDLGGYGYNSTVRNYPRLRLGARVSFRKPGYGSRTRTKAPKTAASVITNQYQYRNVYTKRRSAYPKRAKRFERKVKSVLYRQLGASQFVVHGNFGFTSAINQQGVDGITFLGYSGDVAKQANDVFRCFDQFYQSGTSAVNAAKMESARLVFQTAVIDFAFNNAGDRTLDLDVYTLVCRKDVPLSAFPTGAAATLANFLGQSLNQVTQTNQTALTNLNVFTMGVTPFQSSQFCQYWKVLNKKKFILSSGQVANYQYRSKRTKYVDGADLIENNTTQSVLFAKKGITMGFLFIANGVVFDGSQPASDLDYSSTKTFNVKLLTNNVDTLQLV